MNRKLMALTLAMTMMLTFAACSTSGDSTGGASPNVSDSTDASGTVGSGDSNGSDESDDTDESIDTSKIVYGEIYETIGNLITVKVIETPENLDQLLDRMANGAGEGRAMIGEGVFPTDGSFPADGSFNFEGGDGPQIMWGGDGEMPDMSNFDPANLPEGFVRNADGSGQAFSPEDFEPAYTGEEVDIVIPTGVPIVTTSRGENGMEETEVKLESLKAGDSLLFFYNDEGTFVEKVMLMQGNMIMRSMPVGEMPDMSATTDGGAESP